MHGIEAMPALTDPPDRNGSAPSILFTIFGNNCSTPQAVQCPMGTTLGEAINKSVHGQNAAFITNRVKHGYEYIPQNHDVIHVCCPLKSGAPQLLQDIKHRDLRVSSFNVRGGLTGGKETLIRKLMVDYEIDIIFILETNHDGNTLKNPYGCLAASNIIKDVRNAPHYGTALFVRSHALARELSLLHIDQSQLSVCFQGYALSGLYKIHREDVLDFCDRLTMFEDMPHFSCGDFNGDLYSPTRPSDVIYSGHVNDLGFIVVEKDESHTRFAQFPGHIDSDIDHIVVPEDYLHCCSSGTVVQVDPSISARAGGIS